MAFHTFFFFQTKPQTIFLQGYRVCGDGGGGGGDTFIILLNISWHLTPFLKYHISKDIQIGNIKSTKLCA